VRTHGHATREVDAAREVDAEADAMRESDAEADPTREADAMLDTGFVLRSQRGRTWGAHLMLPISIGWTEFDLGAGVSLDDLATLAVVPTVEFIIPMSERWTLLPFVGAGFAWQTGASDLVGDSDVIGLATGGVRVTRWQHFARRHWFGLTAEVRYDGALTGRDGLLGDWGSFDAAIELRRDFGAPSNGPRFQGGLYVQAFRFWDPVELDIAGVSPPSVKGQVEIGISLGSTSPFKLWRITLPRVFIGWLVGDGVSGMRTALSHGAVCSSCGALMMLSKVRR
jgi:hypothetical protein